LRFCPGFFPEEFIEQTGRLAYVAIKPEQSFKHKTPVFSSIPYNSHLDIKIRWIMRLQQSITGRKIRTTDVFTSEESSTKRQLVNIR
jgi:hypothetical protein